MAAARNTGTGQRAFMRTTLVAVIKSKCMRRQMGRCSRLKRQKFTQNADPALKSRTISRNTEIVCIARDGQGRLDDQITAILSDVSPVICW